MVEQERKNIIIKLPGFLFILLGIIALILGYKLVGAICFGMLLAKEVWLKRIGFVKLAILLIITERLLTSWANIQWWEYSRGGAKFHFEDFKTSEEMQKYFDAHYPVGSDASKLVYDVFTAGGECSVIAMTERSKENFLYEDQYYCHYSNSVLSFDPLLFYNITAFTNSEKGIIRIFVTKHRGP